MTPRAPEVFGDYELYGRLGVGSVSEVFRARSRKLGRFVALKRVMPGCARDPDVLQRLAAETEIARTLDHPGVVKALDQGTVGHQPYVAFELVDGLDFRTLLERAREAEARGEGGLPLAVGLAVLIDVAAALGHAHVKHGVVHRDVSPANMLVSRDGRARLSDFGLARSASGKATSADLVKGSPGYLSPEHLGRAEVGPASDVFALGICLWEVAVGKRLFDGKVTDVMRRIARAQVPGPRAMGAPISEALERIVLKALAEEPTSRYDTAHGLHADLEALARAEGLRAREFDVAREVLRFVDDDAAEFAAAREEQSTMSEEKSDLDVFEGLSRKPSMPPVAGPPTVGAARSSTLMSGGRLPGAPATPLPPPPKSTRPGAPTAAASAPFSALVTNGTPSSPNAVPSSNGIRTPLPPLPPPSGLASPLPPPPAGSTGGTGAMGSMSGMAGASAGPPISVRGPTTPLPPPGPSPSSLRGHGDRAPQSERPAPLPPPPKMPASLPVPAAPTGARPSMDWDDADAKTSVYDKDRGSDVPGQITPNSGNRAPQSVPAPRSAATAALLASSGGSAPKSVPPSGLATGPQSTRPPVSLPPHTAPSGISSPRNTPLPPPLRADARPSRRDEATEVRSRPSQGSSKAGLFLGGLSLVAVVGLGIYTLMPKRGEMSVDISSKSRNIAKAEIFVDGVKVCDTVPCRVRDLEPGRRTIKVSSGEFGTLKPKLELVTAGRETIVVFDLDAEAPTTPAVVAQTAAALPTAPATSAPTLKVAGTQPNVKVLVDGADKGTLPFSGELPAGAHKVVFDGGPRYEKVERSVDLKASQVTDLGEVKLKVVKGLVSIDLGTPGAVVVLVRDVNGRPDKKAVGAPFPRKVEIDPTAGWKVVATKKGFVEFSQPLDFADGKAEFDLKVELVKEGEAPAPVVDPKATTPVAPDAKTAAAPTAAAATASAAPKEAPAEAAGAGTLNINSIPVSKVVLDGRPLGSTPKAGVSVPAGTHTVTFIHPELGKKSVTVTVKAGETKSAAVKFPAAPAP